MTEQKTTTDPKSLLPWFIAGDQPGDYDMGIDPAVAHCGQASGFIKSHPKLHQGFGTLMQMCKADNYLGQRVRMSAYVKTRRVKEWAALWFRVDGEDMKMLSFDNMGNRPLKGTQDWTRYELVLDVPPESKALAFGVLLVGKGQVWVDDFEFMVVGPDVPITGSWDKEKNVEQEYPPRPGNLGFEG